MKNKKNIEGYERMKIGSNIRKWRNIKEVKQKDLASSLRMSEAAVSNMENDLTDLTLSQLEDISLALELPLEKLFADPQETLSYGLQTTSIADNSNNFLMEKELIYTMIGSIQRKDEQFKTIMEGMLDAVKTLTKKGKQ
jgi:transcriptional regulator with XRE-family HTH domain